jgi:hypothetical protein
VLTSRFFEAGQAFKLCHFEVLEGEEWAPPEGSHIVFTEPITADTDAGPVIEGMYLWVLVPSTKMIEVAQEGFRGN